MAKTITTKDRRRGRACAAEDDDGGRGMISSTVLTLLVIPAIYLLVKGRRLGRIPAPERPACRNWLATLARRCGSGGFSGKLPRHFPTVGRA